MAREQEHVVQSVEKIEADIEFLKALGAPAGDGDGSNTAGLMKALNDRIEQLRTEFAENVKTVDFNTNAKVDIIRDDFEKRLNEITRIDIIQQN